VLSGWRCVRVLAGAYFGAVLEDAGRPRRMGESSIRDHAHEGDGAGVGGPNPRVVFRATVTGTAYPSA